MTDKELEQRLEKALSAAAPDDVEGVLSRCEARKGIVIPMKKRTTGKMWKSLAAACLALVLVGGGGAYYYQANAVASVVSLDVNPCIELKVNKSEKVLSADPMNADGAVILEGMDLKGTKADVAMYAIIGALRRHFQEIDYLVTYNGRQFDVPYLRKRAKLLGLAPFRYNLSNLDLYMLIKGYSEVSFFLKNIKQKTVEAYMGFADDRRDTISGVESIFLYESFQQCQDAELRDILDNRILLHNHDDLLQLYRLLPIIRQLDFHKGINMLGFPVLGENGWPYLSVTRARAVGREFEISGQYNGPEFSYVSYDTFLHYYSCEFYDDGDFVFKIPVERHKGNSFIRLSLYFDDFSDLKRYPGFANGFMLVSRGLEPCHMDSSMFAQKFLRDFMQKNICPLAAMYPL